MDMIKIDCLIHGHIQCMYTNLQFCSAVFVLIVMSIGLVSAGKLKLSTNTYIEDQSSILDKIAAFLINLEEVFQMVLRSMNGQ